MYETKKNYICNIKQYIIMREILFKGKTSAGYWVYGGYYYDKELNEHRIILDSVDYSEICISVEVIPETICQYTGLKDKNGTKIFEGDIRSGDYYFDNEKTYYEEVLVYGNYGFYWKPLINSKPDYKETEVTGNIHDKKDK